MVPRLNPKYGLKDWDSGDENLGPDTTVHRFLMEPSEFFLPDTVSFNIRTRLFLPKILNEKHLYRDGKEEYPIFSMSLSNSLKRIWYPDIFFLLN